MLITNIQIGKNGFKEGNYLALKNALLTHEQVRIKFFKTSGERDEIRNIAKRIKSRLEADIKRRIIIKKIGFTLVIIKFRKKL